MSSLSCNPGDLRGARTVLYIVNSNEPASSARKRLLPIERYRILAKEESTSEDGYD
jgi:hypothetical protein